MSKYTIKKGWLSLITLVFCISICSYSKTDQKSKLKPESVLDTSPWWVPVKDYKPLQPGEHPRLLFRKADLASLRKKALTPEGKAIIKRLRYLLDGKYGETMTTVFSPATHAYMLGDKKDMTLEMPGIYTFSHAAGYGLLYQLTGDRKYSEFGKQCFELALNGQRDRDDRYSWINPGGALRAGPILGWYALGYDLCYNGWDEATREKFGKAIENYYVGREQGDAKAVINLESLVSGTMPPKSNHYGMQVGGAAMALMVLTGETWVNQKRIDSLLNISEKSMIRNLNEGFGDGGFFTEGDGTGSMSSHIVYLTAIQAWKQAMGMDFINVSRPNVRMTALKWIYLTVVRNGKPDFWPIRGAYGHNVWDRKLSGGGYFGIGMGAVTEIQRSAIKWYYNHFMLSSDIVAGIPYDSGSYPHSAVCAFINWPVNLPERNPSEVLPLCYRDSIRNFYAWRNRWQDDDDIVISVLTKPTIGYYVTKPDSSMQIAAFGKKISWGKVLGAVKFWHSSPKGETSVLTLENGTSVAVDFTKASGVEAMLVTSGEADGQKVKIGESILTFKFLTTGREPPIKIDGKKVIIGKQSLNIKDGNIILNINKSL